MSTNPDQHERINIGPEGYSEGTLMPPLDELEGMEVRDSSGEKIGKVDDVYTDTGGGYVRYLAVKTGWFGSKRHMIPVDDARVESDGEDTYLTVPYAKDDLRDAPTHDRDEEFTHRHEEETYGHYGRPGYWEAVRARQTTPAPTPEIAEAEVQAAIDRGDDPNGVAVKRWGI